MRRSHTRARPILACLSIALTSALSICAPARAVIPGDVDGDGRVTVVDAVAALRMAALGAGPAERWLRADVWPRPGPDGRLWGDGAVTKDDVRAILRLALSPEPPVDEGPLVVTIAGQADAGPADGVGTAAAFADPYDVALAPGGDLFVAESSGQRIRRIRPDGRVDTYCGSGRRGYQDGDPKSACFNGPYGVAVAADGSLFVADAFNNRIRRVATDGTVTTFAGTGQPGFRDGPGASAQFKDPEGLRIDRQGVLWVADTGNERIRRIAPDGSVTTVAGDGGRGFVDGPALQARFSSPSGVFPDPADGSLWIADTYNHAIRRLTPDGTVVTVAGDGTPGLRDGRASGARFFRPYGFAADGYGSILVADWGNAAVRRIRPSGMVETVAGDGREGYRDGPARSAELRGLMNIAVDARGRIYCADTDNQRIRVIVP